MNLKIKIDKYGNLVNLDTGTIILVSNELFTDNFWETDGTTWKVNTTTQVTASTNDTMPTVVPIGEFTQHSRVDFYFRLHLPILDYNKRVNIFEFSTGTNVSNDISFCKLANSNGYDLFVSGSRQQLHIASTESLDIVGVLTMYNIGSNTIAVFITLYSNEDGTLTKLLEYAYRGTSGNRLYFGVSRDYHTNLSSYMVEGIAFDEDIIINPSNNNVNPISAVTKYLNGTGLSEVWTNTKNYVSAQLLGKSDVGHTHSASDITSGLTTVATSGSYNDLTNKPTIPTVNNATLTIQKNGTTVDTFTANASSNVTANITVPTKTSDLTNDSGFITADNTKIPLAGTNALSGNIIPSTDNSYDLGSNSYGFNRTFTLYVQGNNTKELSLFSSNNTYDPWNRGAYLSLFTNDYSTYAERTGTFTLMAVGLNDTKVALTGTPSGTLTWGSKNVAMAEDTIPRSGGAVLTGSTFSRADTNGELFLYSGTNWYDSGYIEMYGNNSAGYGKGFVILGAAISQDIHQVMILQPNGTWTWTGTACQITSDQRLKQQIAEIDDKLLDAWEDVNLVQFKYNDAVEEKGDNARLHTGYVVQQIDEACKSHGVDISEYGLYCHEEYPERTEEVEVEQADGTTTKETKVIEKASEHYSLRYTEALIVECAYLRKCIKELRNEIEQLKSSK